MTKNFVALALFLFDLLPASVVRTSAYTRIRQLLSKQPQRFEIPESPALPFTGAQWRERKFASHKTDLVIEGFPGSGNSFVSNSLRAAVSRPVNIESHFHHVAQLKRAIALEIPAIVIVRTPLDACNAYKSKQPLLNDWVILTYWVRYNLFALNHHLSLHLFLFSTLIKDVDLIRRRTAAVNDLVSGPIVPINEYRRAGEQPVNIHEKCLLTGYLLRWANRIYGEIENVAIGKT